MEEYNWLNRFLEIASQAILKAHYEFINWSIGQSGVNSKESVFNNNVRGIELADEPTICSLITIEALKSPLFSGDFDPKDTNKKHPKYYRINRELQYIESKRVDIVLQRFEPSSLDNVDNTFSPVYIEAKRAERYSISDISSGKIKEIKCLNEDIDEDIIKIKKAPNNIHKYILIWGIYEKDKIDSSSKNYTPNELINVLKNKSEIQNSFIRWLPISWEKSDISTPSTNITKWIWILMLEIKPVPNTTYDNKEQ